MVERRSQHELDKARRRLHLVDGFLLAMRDLDAVVAAIRQAADGPEASRHLQVGCLPACLPARLPACLPVCLPLSLPVRSVCGVCLLCHCHDWGSE